MNDVKGIFIGRCSHDNDVKYPYFWAQVIKDTANSLNIKMIDLQNENFTKEKFKKLIEKYNPSFIFCSGHGNPWSIKGYNDKPVIEACKNDALLKDKIVYFVSCFTTKILGRSAIDKGCSCYIGYKSKLCYPTFIPPPENILDDFWAKPFMEASNKIPLTLLRGGTPEEAYKNSQKEFNKWIKFWGEQKIEGASTVIKFLRIAKKAQTMIQKL